MSFLIHKFHLLISAKNIIILIKICSSKQIPVTYPATAPEIALPELDGKTAKMYRGGRICLTDHFKPLWARNVPKFGIAHAMALGVSTLLSNFKFINFYIRFLTFNFLYYY